MCEIVVLFSGVDSGVVESAVRLEIFQYQMSTVEY